MSVSNHFPRPLAGEGKGEGIALTNPLIPTFSLKGEGKWSPRDLQKHSRGGLTKTIGFFYKDFQIGRERKWKNARLM